jgi:hypothetical protein
MPKYKSLLARIPVTAGISLVACNLPASTAPPPTDQSAAYTQAAENIIAQMTEAAGQFSPTSPEEIQIVATSTATSPAATATATELPTATEPPPTATATSSPAPSPTATLTAGDPRAGLGEPAFSDPFDNGNNWPLYTDKHVSFSVKDSNLVMVAFKPDRYTGWMLTWPVISEFYLEMIAKPRNCSGLDHYGMMFRATKTDKGYIGYVYGISCDGKFSLRSWDGSKFTKLVDWTPSEHLLSGANQTNRVGVQAEGNRISMYANGKLIKEINDDTHQEGRFGVAVGSANTPDFKAWVDEIAYWDIP